ncbi:MAG TPA: cache domain-containing protein, partial [Coriobacteriia bacterium]|nr:cache domain-containing protein [Coriobacteriia bacterium]
MRGRIAFKLTAIWLAVAVPLVAILVGTYVQIYDARIAEIQQERIGYARLSAFAFRSLIMDAQRTMLVLGDQSVEAKDAPDALTEGLRRVVAQYPATYIAMLDEDGEVVAASDESLVGQDFSSLEAYALATTSADGGAIEPSTSTEDGNPGVHVVQRIYSDAREPLGAMVMRIDLERLHEEFPLDVPTGGISIIDSWGQVVF